MSATLTWTKVARDDGVRHYASTDDRFEIINAQPWKTFGVPWKLYRNDDEVLLNFLGRFPTRKAAQARAEELIAQEAS